MDFGLDAQALSELVGGDKQWAESIIDAFGSTNGMCVTSFCVHDRAECSPSVES